MSNNWIPLPDSIYDDDNALDISHFDPSLVTQAGGWNDQSNLPPPALDLEFPTQAFSQAPHDSQTLAWHHNIDPMLLTQGANSSSNDTYVNSGQPSTGDNGKVDVVTPSRPAPVGARDDYLGIHGELTAQRYDYSGQAGRRRMTAEDFARIQLGLRNTSTQQFQHTSYGHGMPQTPVRRDKYTVQDLSGFHSNTGEPQYHPSLQHHVSPNALHDKHADAVDHRLRALQQQYSGTQGTVFGGVLPYSTHAPGFAQETPLQQSEAMSAQHQMSTIDTEELPDNPAVHHSSTPRSPIIDEETGKRICVNDGCKKLLPASRADNRCARCRTQYDNQKRGPTQVNFIENMDFEQAHRLIFSMQNDYDMRTQSAESKIDFANNTTPAMRQTWVKQFIEAFNHVYKIPAGIYRNEQDRITAEQFVANQEGYNLKFGHQDRQYNTRVINARAHMLFEAAQRFQSGNMVTVYDDGGDNGGYSVDGDIVLSERLRRICEALQEDKRIVMDVIEGRGVNALVRDPWAYQHRKIDNVKSNYKKRKTKMDVQGRDGSTPMEPSGSRKTQMIKTRLALSEQQRDQDADSTLLDRNTPTNFIKVGPPRGRHKKRMSTLSKRKRGTAVVDDEDDEQFDDGLDQQDPTLFSPASHAANVGHARLPAHSEVHQSPQTTQNIATSIEIDQQPASASAHPFSADLGPQMSLYNDFYKVGQGHTEHSMQSMVDTLRARAYRTEQYSQMTMPAPTAQMHEYNWPSAAAASHNADAMDLGGLVNTDELQSELVGQSNIDLTDETTHFYHQMEH